MAARRTISIIIKNSTTTGSLNTTSPLCSSLIPAAGARGLAHNRVFKERQEFRERKEHASRLFVADEGFHYSRTWAEKESNKITATCVEEIDFSSPNVKYLKSRRNANVLGGIDPSQLESCPELKDKNFNSIHINFPDPAILKPFFQQAKMMLRGFGEIEVLLDPMAESYKGMRITEKASEAGLRLKKTVKFNGPVFKYYSPPAAVKPPQEKTNPATKPEDYGLKVQHYVVEA